VRERAEVLGLVDVGLFPGLLRALGDRVPVALDLLDAALRVLEVEGDGWQRRRQRLERGEGLHHLAADHLALLARLEDHAPGVGEARHERGAHCLDRALEHLVPEREEHVAEHAREHRRELREVHLHGERTVLDRRLAVREDHPVEVAHRVLHDRVDELLELQRRELFRAPDERVDAHGDLGDRQIDLRGTQLVGEAEASEDALDEVADEMPLGRFVELRLGDLRGGSSTSSLP
jgi:hypothetical protein